GRRLLKREASRLWRHRPHGTSADIFGKRAVSSAEHFVARLALRHILSARLNGAGKINAKTYLFWFTQPDAHRAHDIWRALNEMPVVRVDRHRVNLDQNLVIIRDWLFNIFAFEFCHAIIATNDRFHRVCWRSRFAALISRSPVGDEQKDE